MRHPRRGLRRALAHILIGMIIGAMVSLHEARPAGRPAPLAAALTERADRLGDAFRRIVFAQVRISVLNTAADRHLPDRRAALLGVHLPLHRRP